jgi:hypothetical protein
LLPFRTVYPKQCSTDTQCTQIWETKCESGRPTYEHAYEQKCEQVPVQKCLPVKKCHRTPKTKCR